MNKYICALLCLFVPLLANAAPLGNMGDFPLTISDTREGLAPGAYDDYYTFFSVANTSNAIVSFSLSASNPDLFLPGAFSIELYEGISSPAGVPIAYGISNGGQPSLSFTADLLMDTMYTIRTSFNFGIAGTGVLVDATTTVSEIPLPAAAWLFGSGLVGLVGIARRRRHP